ncbi:MAG TPA: MltA domain-containing protein, partial [Saliniramus sp.]|nr:MltA domain-containing protein [Saliniramus sp.]
SFETLPGWETDDHAAALAVFLRSCNAIIDGAPELRPAGKTGENLLAVCRSARSGEIDDPKTFFERHFVPHAVTPESGTGFLTGYFEPEYEGSLEVSDDYAVPLLARPHDLVTIAAGESLPGIPEDLHAAARTGDGYAPYPDRAAIEDGVLGERARPIVHLRHAAEAFIIHVQGSARIRLPDGGVVRVGYAGRNGHPYSSIGRIIVEQGAIERDEMSLERLLGWLKANPDEAREIMRRNRSYIFFTILDELGPDEGPIGGAGISLTPGRSLAVDRQLWRYGLPFWLDGDVPDVDGVERRLQRLMIAQDTGSAIVGPARGDFFTGTGAKAGTQAGLIRHRPRFVVLLPRPRDGG